MQMAISDTAFCLNNNPRPFHSYYEMHVPGERHDASLHSELA